MKIMPLVIVTNVVVEYAKKHVETRWFTMKYVALPIVEQWDNLTEYSLKFLPKQKNFKSTIMKTERYQQISESLKDPLNLCYTSFCAFATNDFESFLLPFQSEEPMIHLLYPEMYKLLESLMTKFIRKKRLANISSDDMHKIDVTKKTNHKPVNFIEVGTKAKVLFSDFLIDFIPSEKHVKFRREYLQFYISSVKYLQVQLPFDIDVIKHAQYLHPEKRNQSGATSAIWNLALKIANVLKDRLTVVFGVKQDAIKDDVCDTIRNQWMRYQNEEIPEDFFIVSRTDESSRLILGIRT